LFLKLKDGLKRSAERLLELIDEFSHNGNGAKTIGEIREITAPAIETIVITPEKISLPVVTADPAVITEGDLWFRSDLEKLRINTIGGVRSIPAEGLSGRLADVIVGGAEPGVGDTSSRMIDLGVGATREINAGKLAYASPWDTTALGIIGTGTVSGERRIRMWDRVFIEDYLNVGLGWDFTRPLQSRGEIASRISGAGFSFDDRTYGWDYRWVLYATDYNAKLWRGADKVIWSLEGHYRPAVDNAQDLGSSTLFWRNIFQKGRHYFEPDSYIYYNTTELKLEFIVDGVLVLRVSG